MSICVNQLSEPLVFFVKKQHRWSLTEIRCSKPWHKHRRCWAWNPITCRRDLEGWWQRPSTNSSSPSVVVGWWIFSQSSFGFSLEIRTLQLIHWYTCIEFVLLTHNESIMNPRSMHFTTLLWCRPLRSLASTVDHDRRRECEALRKQTLWERPLSIADSMKQKQVAFEPNRTDGWIDVDMDGSNIKRKIHLNLSMRLN